MTDGKKESRKTRRIGRGSVLLISALLILSGGLRIASGTGVALASGTQGEPVEHAGNGETVHDAQSDFGSHGSATLPNRKELGSLLKALQDRETRAAERESQIELRAKALAITDAEIQKRLASLEKAESDLRAILALADGAAENDLANLTTVYENMKPKDAAALFEKMDPDFAAGFLGRMRPDAAASVLAGLTPEAAYAISVILAGRNANVPRN